MEETLRRHREKEKAIDRTLELSYGRGKLTLRLPQSVEATDIVPAVMRATPKPGAVTEALRNPMGSPRLEEVARGKRNVLVVIPDKTRASGAGCYLPPVLDALDRAGVRSGEIRLITANGAHPQMSEEELLEIVGAEISGRHRIVQHDAMDESALVEVGRTSRGTRVAINRLCVESDLVILTGSLSYHYFAGFGGGRKTLFPGLAAYHSIVANHRLTLGPGEGLDPRCGAGVLEGNPVHEDIMEAFAMLPSPFVLNIVVAPGGGIVEAFAGSHEHVFENACDATRRGFAAKLGEEADLVIASCGGFPWDINLLQMHKGIRNASLATRDGGAVVLVGEGGQGVGSATLEKGLGHKSWREADKAARRSYVLNAHTAVALLQQTARVSLHMVSRVADLPCAGPWATYYPDVQSAYEGAVRELGSENPLTYYIPLACITVPETQS